MDKRTKRVNSKCVDGDRRLRILRAAMDVFMRYGYRRATMDDVAREVGISRPALYLTFPGKEAVFRGVVEMGHEELLRDIEAGLPSQGSVSAKLMHVFELWSVRSFDMVARSPAASELMTSSYDFASDLFDLAAEHLASILGNVIGSAVAEPDALQPSAEARARIMIAAAHGFKSVARDTQGMRALVHDLVRMTVAGLPGEGKAARTPRRPRQRNAGKPRRGQ